MEDKSSEQKKEVNVPKENSTSKVGAANSLIGLIVIGAAVYFGLPYIQETIKSAIASISAPAEEEKVIDKEDQDEAATTAEIVKKVATAVQPSGWTDEDQEMLEEAAEDGIRLAIRGAKRQGFKLFSAKRSAKTDSFLITFEFDESLYELKFTKDEEFSRYVSEVVKEELKPHFSIAPSFSIHD